MKLKPIFLPILIIVLIVITRLSFLSQIPTSLTQDEAAIGYNAFSILKTAKDEWGNLLPSQFKSVGDYKLPVLIYLTVPFVALFGKTELAVRLPVALASIITIYVYYCLSKKNIFSKKNKHLATLSALLLTLSPWHIFFSRSGFEAILGLLFSLLFLKSILDLLESHQAKNLWLAVLYGLLGSISYHSTKVFIPLLLLTLLLKFKTQWLSIITSWWKKSKNSTLTSILGVLSLSLVFVSVYIFGAGATRAKMTILYNDFIYARVLVPLLKYAAYPNVKSLFLLLFFWFKRFMGYFQPNFYISSGLGLVSSGQPGQGVIYAIEFIFLCLGLLFLIRRSKLQNWLKTPFQTSFIIFSWLLLSFIPASLANNPQHALRSLVATPAIYWLISLGVVTSFQYIKSTKKTLYIYIFSAIVISSYIGGVVKFSDYYLVHYPQQMAEFRHLGWKELAIFANQHSSGYDKIYIDPRFGSEGPYTVGVPYLYFLFYSTQDPRQYNQDQQRQEEKTSFKNFHFEEINWYGLNHINQNNLYIASPWSFPLGKLDQSQILLKIYYPNGKLGFMVVKDIQHL